MSSMCVVIVDIENYKINMDVLCHDNITSDSDLLTCTIVSHLSQKCGENYIISCVQNLVIYCQYQGFGVTLKSTNPDLVSGGPGLVLA